MYIAFVVTSIILIIFTLFFIWKASELVPSRAQNSFLIYLVFNLIFMAGIYLELTMSHSIESALIPIKIQYVGQIGFLLGYMSFSSYIGKYKISKIIWLTVISICAVSLLGVFSAEYNNFFYRSSQIVTTGVYPRLEVKAGVLWYVHYLNMFFVYFITMFLSIRNYKKSSALTKKRIICVDCGISILFVELIMKYLGIFGSYNPVLFALIFTMIVFYVGMIKFGYLDYIQIGTEEALNQGKEGLILLDEKKEIIYKNKIIKQIIPNLPENCDIYYDFRLEQAFVERICKLEFDSKSYQVRVEEILDHGIVSGYMMWFVDMTDYDTRIEEIYDLSEILEEVWNITINEAEEKDFGMSFEVEKVLSSKYYGDVIVIKEILYNIISNIIKYAENGNIVLDVEEANEVDGKKSNIVAGENLREKCVLKYKFTLTDESKSQYYDLPVDIQDRKKEALKTGIDASKQLARYIGGNVDTKKFMGETNIIEFIIPQYKIYSGRIDFENINRSEVYGDIQGRYSFMENQLIALREADINIKEGIKYSDDSEEFFVELVNVFISEYEDSCQNVKSAYYVHDYDKYEVLVHGLKNNARAIGADRLADLSYELEMKCKNHNLDGILKVHTLMLEEWKRIVSILSKAFS